MVRWLKRDLKAAEIVILVVLIVLLGARAVLPGVLKHQINKRLAGISGYTGWVDDVGVHVWHGGYTMYGLVIRKRDAPKAEPFIAARSITFTLAYRDLLHGRFTSDIVVQQGRIDFVRSPAPQAEQDLGSARSPGGTPAPSRTWQDAVRDLFPLRITHLELVDSRIRYVDETVEPRVDIALDPLQLTANGLRNRPGKADQALPATITLNGRTLGGAIHAVIRAEPLAEQPHFTVKLALENISLPALNPFLLAHADADVSRGVLELYLEMNAAGGAYRGYVKPIFTNLDFRTASDEHKPPLQLLWKDVVEAVTKLMRDKQKKQVATIVPFSGSFARTSTVRVGPTLRNLYYNGFIEALRRGLEGSPAATAPTTAGL